MRSSPILSLFAASLIMLAPAQAFAQDRTQDQEGDIVSVRDRARPEYDPAGLRFGGFDLNASLDLAVTNTDNLFAEETNENSDTYLELSPRARLSSHWSRHELAFEAGGTFPSHQDFSSEDVNTGFGRVHGRYDVGVSTSISGDAGIAHEVESRLDPDGPPQGVPLVEYDRSDLSVSAQHRFNRVLISGSAARSEYNYDGAQSFRDFDETAFTGRVEAEVTPRIGLLLQATSDNRDYDNTPGLSSDGQTYLVGATIHLTDLMRGQIAVGQFNRDYDSGISEEGFAVDANLEYYITRLTTITVNARRNTEDTIGATTAFPYVQTVYGARIDHELLRNLILTAGAQIGKRDYDVINRTDDFVHAEVGADYLVSRRWAVRARYMHDEVDSDAVTRDYDVNRFTLGVAFRL